MLTNQECVSKFEKKGVFIFQKQYNMKQKRVREKYYESEADSILKKQMEKTAWKYKETKEKDGCARQFCARYLF